MSIEEDILIEHFLKNTLSETDKKAVLERMKTDLIFKEKVLFEQQLSETLDEKNWNFVKNTDETLVKEYENLYKSDEVKNIQKSITKANQNFKDRKPSRYKSWYIYSSAAVIALLFSVYLFNPVNQTSEEIYNSYLNEIDLPSMVNRGNENQLKNLLQGQTFFENKEYEKAATIFSNEAINKTTNSNTYIYLAMSQIELNQFENAEKNLDSLIHSSLIDANKGYWFKSLLYLKTKKTSKAKNILNLIVKNSYYNYQEAKELLKKIK